jgi:hypothetical protein
MFLAAMGPVSTAKAESVAQFYKGKRITLFIGGGGRRR